MSGGGPGARSPVSSGVLPASDNRPAIVEPGRGVVSYAQLDALADGVAARLHALGIERGARIGLYVRRSTDAIAAMLGTLRAGCAYVPVDPRWPVERIAGIHSDCRVHASFVEEPFAAAYRGALSRGNAADAALLTLEPAGLGHAIAGWLESSDAPRLVKRADDVPQAGPDLACLLYTSGTTGQPKGWMMSRGAIAAHAAWCHRLLTPGAGDVFANHAPFSFGMSLFDIYSSLGCGAALVLVPDAVRQHAARVADLIAAERVSIWFSGPAILALMGQLPDLGVRDLSALRVVAFAGEVFPLLQLNTLRSRLPHPRWFNFYGSTETNVAAYYELPPGPLDAPPPIGRPCEHYSARVAGDDGEPLSPGMAGELQLRGAGLAMGYWNASPTPARLCEAADGGDPWFRTRDLVVQLGTGDFRYAGRLGRMVKLRGYRVEPGEIEARLYQHEAIREVGVVPSESAAGLELVAHVATVTGERVPLVQLKEFCAVTMPPYMVPARFEFHPSLPRTSSGKIDLQALRGGVGSTAPA